MALNDRQRRFCDEYMANGGNAYQAALKAGYSESSANDAARWIKAKTLKNPDKKYNPEMVEYITKHSGAIERHNSKIATATELQEFASAVVRGEVGETVVASSGTAVEVPASIRDRLRSADMLAKMKGMYTEQFSINADMDLNITVDYGDKDEC